MTVQAIRQNDGSSRLNTIIKSTAAGTATGYAMKWIWPVTKQEDTFSRRAIVNYSRKITNKKKAAEFNTYTHKTAAQDSFVQMIESKDNKAFFPKNLQLRVDRLGGDSSIAGKEFRAIIRNVDEASRELSKKLIISQKFTLKYIRPSLPFLVAGAGIGFFTGFTHNIMKYD